MTGRGTRARADGLTRWDVVTGTPLGSVRADPLPPHDGASARGALEAAALEAFRRGPCHVAFSGGRDSSVLLALAAHVAAREGLAPPVPVTVRPVGDAAADESAWQRAVIEHLGLREWEIVPIGGEFDLVGPLAADVLRAAGPIYPAYALANLLLLRLCAPGTLVTGLDGDGLFDTWPYGRANAILARRLRPRREDLPALAERLLPATIRGRRRELRAFQMPWLKPAARNAFAQRLAADWGGQPTRWDTRVAWWATRRYLALRQEGLERLAAAAGARVVHPLVEPRFLAALATEGGRIGFLDRTDAFRRLVGDLLPNAALSRVGKSTYDAAYWTDETRAFAATLPAEALDDELVDGERLLDQWRAPSPDMRSAMLLQAAWLDQGPP